MPAQKGVDAPAQVTATIHEEEPAAAPPPVHASLPAQHQVRRPALLGTCAHASERPRVRFKGGYGQALPLAAKTEFCSPPPPPPQYVVHDTSAPPAMGAPVAMHPQLLVVQRRVVGQKLKPEGWCVKISLTIIRAGLQRSQLWMVGRRSRHCATGAASSLWRSSSGLSCAFRAACRNAWRTWSSRRPSTSWCAELLLCRLCLSVPRRDCVTQRSVATRLCAATDCPARSRRSWGRHRCRAASCRTRCEAAPNAFDARMTLDARRARLGTRKPFPFT